MNAKNAVTNCLDYRDMVDYLAHQCPESERNIIAEHLLKCDQCSSLFESIQNEDISDPFVTNPDAGAGLEETAFTKTQPNDGISHRFTSSRYADVEIPGYVIKEKIGEGGMGEVYRAVHRKMNRDVAIKFVHCSQEQQKSIQKRFNREIRIAARVSHQNVIQAWDAGEIDGDPYLVTEYINGIDLRTLIVYEDRLSIANICEIVSQIAIGLQHIMISGLVHRDIKPSNIMISKVGHVKIMDLGLAMVNAELETDTRITKEGKYLGTCDYMAPEQWKDATKVDIRADIYSLGCTMYHLIAGIPPFAKKTTLPTKMYAHFQIEPPLIEKIRTDIPPKLKAVLEKMLAKQKEDRYEFPQQIVDELEPFRSENNLADVIGKVPITLESERSTNVLNDSYTYTVSENKAIESSEIPVLADKERHGSKKSSKGIGVWVFVISGLLLAFIAIVFIQALGVFQRPTDLGQERSKNQLKEQTDDRSNRTKDEDSKMLKSSNADTVKRKKESEKSELKSLVVQNIPPAMTKLDIDRFQLFRQNGDTILEEQGPLDILRFIRQNPDAYRNEQLKFHIEFKSPLYYYLFEVDEQGKPVYCCSSNEKQKQDILVSSASGSITYPKFDRQYHALTQTRYSRFVILASREKLPSWNEFSKENPKLIPWTNRTVLSSYEFWPKEANQVENDFKPRSANMNNYANAVSGLMEYFKAQNRYDFIFVCGFPLKPNS